VYTLVVMDEITARDARRTFRALLDRVEAGEEIVLLRRGKPVARLVPPAVTPARPPRLASLRSSIGVRGRSLREEVLAAREEERY